MKDGDVTWLYGPLQTSSGNLSTPSISGDGIGISEPNCFLNTKSILKKRSVSEIMLQISISASSILNPATSAVRTSRSDAAFTAQKSDRVSIGRVTSDHATLPLSLKSWRRDNVAKFLSVTLSGEQSLGTNERRHIHFNNKVEQFTAADIEDRDGDEDAGDIDSDDDSSSDGLMMRGSSKPNVLDHGKRNSSQTSSSAESRTIAILPSATLKYRADSPSSTQPTTKTQFGSQDEEGDDDIVAAGVIDQVVDAMNTARDIAYVLWNVGWR